MRNTRTIIQAKSRSIDLKLQLAQSQARADIKKAVTELQQIQLECATKENDYKYEIRKLQADPRKLRLDNKNMMITIEKERNIRSEAELLLQREVELRCKALKSSRHV